MRDRLRGIFPPLPTPFDNQDRIDRRGLASNVRRLMATRLTGVLAIGSNGEAAHLDDDECDEVVDVVREAVPRDRVLLVGTGRESTRQTVQACVRAAARGADAVLVRPPSYFKPQMTADALVMHFTAVADASPVPVLLYNLPAVTGVTLTPAVVARLVDHANVVGIKETSMDLERLGQFTALRPGTFRVFSGSAPVGYPALVSGAAGGIFAIANVLPDECTALYEDAVAGRHAEALERQRRLTPMAQLVTSVHGVPGLKAALELAGAVGGPVRAPLARVSAKARDEIAAALSMFGTSPNPEWSQPSKSL